MNAITGVGFLSEAKQVESNVGLNAISATLSHFSDRLEEIAVRAGKNADTLFGPQPTVDGPGSGPLRAPAEGSLALIHEQLDRVRSLIGAVDSAVCRFDLLL